MAFHKHYPLFASGSDDGTVIVCHGMVYKCVGESRGFGVSSPVLPQPRGSTGLQGWECWAAPHLGFGEEGGGAQHLWGEGGRAPR